MVYNIVKILTDIYGFYDISQFKGKEPKGKDICPFSDNVGVIEESFNLFKTVN